MAELFSDLPEAIANTVVMAQRCAFMVPTRDPILPTFSTTSGRDEAAELRAQAEAGLERGWPLKADKSDAEERRGLSGAARLRARRHHPHDLRGLFSDRRRLHQIGQGGGHSGRAWTRLGCGLGRRLVAWRSPISTRCSFGLLFERFLNPERVSMPDFDIDFCQDRRDEVIRYVRDKYGADRRSPRSSPSESCRRAPCCATSAARSVCPTVQVDKVAKLVPFNPGQSADPGRSVAPGAAGWQEAPTRTSRWASLIDVSPSSWKGCRATPRPMLPAW